MERRIFPQHMYGGPKGLGDPFYRYLGTFIQYPFSGIKGSESVYMLHFLPKSQLFFSLNNFLIIILDSWGLVWDIK